MGKKNRPYDGPRVSLGEKTGYLRQQGAERYDINEYDSKYIDDEGNATDADRDADIIKAMNNDFDLRSSQQYGKDAGLDGFKNLGNGLTNTHSAYNTHRAVVDHGTNEMGHKNVSSNQDYANITNDLFNKSRDGLTKDMSPEEQQADAKDSEPYIPSKEMSEAKSRVEEFDNKDYGVYGSSESGDNKDQRTNAANSFLDKYKLDVKSGANFKSTI